MDKTQEKMQELINSHKEETPQGVNTAVQMWLNGKKEFYTRSNRKFTAYELRNFLNDKEVRDFIKTLSETCIKRFVYTNTSTAVMRNLHSLEEEGCRIGNLVLEKNKYNERQGIEILII